MDNIFIKADISDYIGKYQNGVMVLLSINYNDEFFTEGTLYYSTEVLALTVEDAVEEKIGSRIELWSGYRELLISILDRVVPYYEIIDRLDEIKESDYNIPEIDDSEEIDSDDILTS